MTGPLSVPIFQSYISPIQTDQETGYPIPERAFQSYISPIQTADLWPVCVL